MTGQEDIVYPQSCKSFRQQCLSVSRLAPVPLVLIGSELLFALRSRTTGSKWMSESLDPHLHQQRGLLEASLANRTDESSAHIQQGLQMELLMLSSSYLLARRTCWNTLTHKGWQSVRCLFVGTCCCIIKWSESNMFPGSWTAHFMLSTVGFIKQRVTFLLLATRRKTLTTLKEQFVRYAEKCSLNSKIMKQRLSTVSGSDSVGSLIASFTHLFSTSFKRNIS